MAKILSNIQCWNIGADEFEAKSLLISMGSTLVQLFRLVQLVLSHVEGLTVSSVDICSGSHAFSFPCSARSSGVSPAPHLKNLCAHLILRIHCYPCCYWCLQKQRVRRHML